MIVGMQPKRNISWKFPTPRKKQEIPKAIKELFEKAKNDSQSRKPPSCRENLLSGSLTYKFKILAPQTPFATPYTVVKSKVKGPKVLLVGGMHGNEPAGALAAEKIRQWFINKGTLIVIPFCNIQGLNQDSRWLPKMKEEERDLNRNFPTLSRSLEAKTEIGKAIWKLVQKESPDWVIDLHEGGGWHRQNKRSVGSSIIHMQNKSSYDLVDQLLGRVNQTIKEEDKKFTHSGQSRKSSGPIRKGLVRAAIDCLNTRGFVVESTIANQSLDLRIQQHEIIMRCFFQKIGML